MHGGGNVNIKTSTAPCSKRKTSLLYSIYGIHFQRIETSQLISNENQLLGFYGREQWDNY